MVYLLTKKFASINSLFPSYLQHNLTFFTPLFHFSTQFQQKENSPFIAQYLISSFGFPEERALRVASMKKLSLIKTPDRPESVVRFLEEIGLTERDIKSCISWNPQFLCSNVEKILKPRVSELITNGFAGNTLVRLIIYNPSALNRKTTLSALQFWRSFLNNSEEDLLKLMKRKNDFINVNIKDIIPRINFLHEFGLSDKGIATVILRTPSFILRDIDTIKALLERTENLGFQRGSGMFIHGLEVVHSLSKDTIERKMRFFKNTYNWSEEDVNLAIMKCPYILAASEEKLKSTMDFFVTELGFDPRSAASRPVMLRFSLERRLIPRHYVISTLKLKGLEITCSFYTVFMMTEKKFVEKFIVAYKEEVPQLGDSYAAFCDGKMPN